MKKKILIIKLKKLLEKEPIEFAYLFGSQATAEASRFSDIDLAVYFKKKIKDPAWARFSLIGKLKGLLGRDIDIIPLNDLSRLPSYLGYEIVEKGRIIINRNSSLEKKIKERLIKKYQIEIPVLEKQWEETLNHIRQWKV